MYLNKIQLKNIRSFKDTTVEIEPTAGWHVILGDNGSGKSTLIRSIALGMIGAPELHQLAFKQSWNSWLRYEEDQANINLEFNDGLQHSISFSKEYKHAVVKLKASEEDLPVFSAGYGSFRRLTGGSKDYDNVWNNSPKLAAHLSIFGEDVALDKWQDWFEELHYNDSSKKYIQKEIPKQQILGQTSDVLNSTKKNTDVVSFFSLIAEFIDKSELLLNKYTPSLHNFLETPFKKISFFFQDQSPEGFVIEMNNLSDGYKSVLALVLELIRQLSSFYQNGSTTIFDRTNDKITVTATGIVLIDEVAAHLHPSWQAKIGDWFTEYFPNIQFIVTTHSPIICRSAKKGSIQKIIHQGEATIIDKIEGKEKNQLVYGDILDAYNTDLFGENISRSQDAVAKLKRLAKLETLKQFEQQLSQEEEKELVELSKLFPSDANSPF